jgi:hypothetical protein
MITVITVIDNNHDQLLSHFINHYSLLKVTNFIFGVKNGKNNPAWNYIVEYSKSKTNIHVDLKEYFTDNYSINGIADSFFINHTKNILKTWYIPADLDEFHNIDNIPFTSLKEICSSGNHKYVRSQLIDRISNDGNIPQTIDQDNNIFLQFPLEKPITQNISGGCIDKICFLHPDVDVGAGHHNLTDDSKKLYSQHQYPIIGKTYHFKWFGDVIQREEKKMIARQKNNYIKWSNQQIKLLTYLNEHNYNLLNAS